MWYLLCSLQNVLYGFVCFLIADHEHSHKKNKRKHWRRQWAESSLLSDMEMLKHSLEVNSFSADSNKTGNMSEKKSHRRTKRFLSYPRFVEVMVVADSRMVAYHGANLQHYVLTLMSIVSIQLRGVDSSMNLFLLVTVSPFCCTLMQYPQFGSARHGDNGGVRVKSDKTWLRNSGWSLPPSQTHRFSRPFPHLFHPAFQTLGSTRSVTALSVHVLYSSSSLRPCEIAAELKRSFGDCAFRGTDAYWLGSRMTSLAVARRRSLWSP